MPLVVAAGIVGVLAFAAYLLWRAQKRWERDVWRIERKVGRRDLILRSDIETLMRARSPLLSDAIELRRQQTEEHRHPESEGPCDV